MKKALLAASLLCAATLSHAGDPNGTMAIQASGKKVISNGFFLNLGLSFPSAKAKSIDGKTVTDPKSESLGIQPSIEIGNQWYFVKKETFGFGLKVSWLQFGYSAKKIDQVKSTTIDLRFIKVAPMATFGFNDEMGLDVYVDIAPTVLFTAYKPDGATEVTAGQAVAGVLFAPGARFRYKKFAAGTDFSMGTLGGAIKPKDGDVTTDIKLSVFSPRVYVGFKF